MSEPRGRGPGNGGLQAAPEGGRWSFLRRTIEDLQRKQARFPERWFRGLSDWASRQERTGLLRFWSPGPRAREAGDIWVLEDRDVRLDPFFLTSVLFHLILALLLWQALSRLPEPEPKKPEEVVVRLEKFLPSDAGQAAAAPAPKPEPAKPAAAPKKVVAKAPTPKATAPKPKPRPTPVVQKPVPKPEPEPILAPKQINAPKAISMKAPVSPHTPTLSERVADVRAPTAGAEVSMGAGASASDIDVDVGGTGVRGPVGPVSVPGGQGAGTGLGAGTGRGNIQGSPMRSMETDPDFQEYLEKIKKRIQQVWDYPPGIAGRQTVVLVFRLDAGARAYDISVKRSTNVGLNRSAMDAMKRGSPFPPIPTKFRGVIGVPLALTISVTITGTG